MPLTPSRSITPGSDRTLAPRRGPADKTARRRRIAAAGLVPVLAAVVLLTIAPAPSAHAQDDPPPSRDEPDRLDEAAEEARAEAARLAADAERAAAELERLQYALVDAARARGDAEREALAIEGRLDALGVEEATLSAQIEADHDALEDVFAALARLERGRPPAALANGEDVLAAARAAGLLAQVAPDLDARARAAVERLETLRAVRAAAAAESDTLAEAETSLGLQRQEISALIDARAVQLASLRAQSAEAEAAATALAARAQTLRDLIAALDARAEAFTPPAPTPRASGLPQPRLKPDPDAIGVAAAPFTAPTGRFADAQGALTLPAAGRIVARRGELHAGRVSEGLVIRSRPAALVTTPFDARVEHVGPFGGYGLLVLLNVGDGHRIVLSGLDRTFVERDQTLLAGEPVGEMVDASDPPPDLYVEIRKDGQVVDPDPWWRGGP